MKLAVIDHILNPGGGARVARSILPAMKKIRPDLQITFFGNPHGVQRDRLIPLLKECEIAFVPLKSMALSGKDLLGIRGSRHVVSKFQNQLKPLHTLLPFSVSGALQQELESKVKGFEAALFTWPFHLHCPQLDCPMAGIFHDFNFKYYFSGSNLFSWREKFLNDQMPIWLKQSTPIVSSDFMKSEVAKFYPQAAHKVKVVPIAPMTHLSSVNPNNAPSIVEKLPIPKNYILCPTHTLSHKNAGPLIAAQALLRQKGHTIALVFAGSGTEIMNGKAVSIGIELDQTPQDVYGLGYVSNEEIDALIQCARIVVNPSLYEGGNGPGFDAWARGVPVAMSNIPPFLEHMQVHDVRAAIFDPRTPQEIAEKLETILLNPQKAAEDCNHSQKAISHFTWEKAAGGYLNAIEETLQKVL